MRHPRRVDINMRHPCMEGGNKPASPREGGYNQASTIERGGWITEIEVCVSHAFASFREGWKW